MEDETITFGGVEFPKDDVIDAIEDAHDGDTDNLDGANLVGVSDGVIVKYDDFENDSDASIVNLRSQKVAFAATDRVYRDASVNLPTFSGYQMEEVVYEKYGGDITVYRDGMDDVWIDVEEGARRVVEDDTAFLLTTSDLENAFGDLL